MEHPLNRIVEKTKNAVKYWWLLLIVGIALFAVGIIVFFYPGESYLALSIVFGIVLLLSGVIQLVLAIANQNYFTNRAWVIVGGIIDIILGIILCSNIALSAITLPFLLGFWLMYRGFMMIGLGSDMSTFRISGSTWTIIWGVLLILCSILVLLQPLAFGTSMVVALLGISFLVAGIASCYIAFQLKNVHKNVKKIME